MSGQSQDHRETENDQKMQLQAGTPEAPFNQLPPEAPRLANKNGGMLRESSLLQPNVRQTYLDPEVPISEQGPIQRTTSNHFSNEHAQQR